MDSYVDKAPDQPSEIHETVRDSLTISQREMHFAGSPDLGKSHPDNVMYSPFSHEPRKTSWYLPMCRQISSRIENEVFKDQVLWKITMVSETKPSLTIKLDNQILESTSSGLDLVQSRPGIWSPECFFNGTGFPLWALNGDRLKFYFSGDLFLHTAYVHSEYIATHDTHKIYKYTVKTIEHPETLGDIKNRIVTKFSYMTDASSVDILYNQRHLWNIPTEIFKVEDRVVFSTSIDEMMGFPERESLPGCGISTFTGELSTTTELEDLEINSERLLSFRVGKNTIEII